MLQEDWTGICQSQSRLMCCFRLFCASWFLSVVFFLCLSVCFFGSCCFRQEFVCEFLRFMLLRSVPTQANSGLPCSICSAQVGKYMQPGQPTWPTKVEDPLACTSLLTSSFSPAFIPTYMPPRTLPHSRTHR